MGAGNFGVSPTSLINSAFINQANELEQRIVERDTNRKEIKRLGGTGAAYNQAESDYRTARAVNKQLNESITGMIDASTGLDDIKTKLQSIQSLVQGALDGNITDLDAAQESINEYVRDIQSIVSITEFKNQKVFGGNFETSTLKEIDVSNLSIDLKNTETGNAAPPSVLPSLPGAGSGLTFDRKFFGTTGQGYSDSYSFTGPQQTVAEAVSLSDVAMNSNYVAASRENAGGTTVFTDTIDRIGTDTLVNTTSGLPQYGSSVTALEGGGYVATWTSLTASADTFEVMGQVFDNSGNKVGGEITLSTNTADTQAGAEVAALEGGGFVAVWSSDHTGDSNVYAQRFDATGNKVGAETLVNTTTTNDQLSASVSGTSDGGFTVSWTSEDQNSGSNGIYAQRFNSSGVAQGSEFLVDTALIDQSSSQVLGLSNGNFLVAYNKGGTTANGDSSQGGVFGSLYDSNGNVLESNIRLNEVTIANQRDPVLTELSNGDIAVALESNGSMGNDIDGYGIELNIFNSNDLGKESFNFMDVNQTTFGDQRVDDIVALDNGEFVVSWTGDGLDEVFARRFDSNAVALDNEFSLSDNTTGDQKFSSLAVLSNGNLVATFDDNVIDGSSIGIAQSTFEVGYFNGTLSDGQVDLRAKDGTVLDTLSGADVGVYELGIVTEINENNILVSAGETGIYMQDVTGADLNATLGTLLKDTEANVINPFEMNGNKTLAGNIDIAMNDNYLAVSFYTDQDQSNVFVYDLNAADPSTALYDLSDTVGGDGSGNGGLDIALDGDRLIVGGVYSSPEAFATGREGGFAITYDLANNGQELTRFESDAPNWGDVGYGTEVAISGNVGIVNAGTETLLFDATTGASMGTINHSIGIGGSLDSRTVKDYQVKDGKLLASVGEGDQARIKAFDLSNNQEVASLELDNYLAASISDINFDFAGDEIVAYQTGVDGVDSYIYELDSQMNAVIDEDEFGEKVVMTDRYLAVASPGFDSATQANLGAINIYDRANGDLVASIENYEADFDFEINGDTLAMAYGSGVGLFDLANNGEMFPGGLGLGYQFGNFDTVEMTDDYIVVGNKDVDDPTSGFKDVTVYRNNGSFLDVVNTFQAYDGSTPDSSFGDSITIDGGRMIVGDNLNGNFSVFDIETGAIQANITGIDGRDSKVALSGDYAIITGANETETNYGDIAIYDISGGLGNETLLNTIERPVGSVNFGESIDVDGDKLIVGDSGFNGNAGAAFLYSIPSGALLDTIEADPAPTVDPVDPTPQAIGAEIRVNNSETGIQAESAITTLNNGNYVVSWQDQDDSNFYAQIYSAAGAEIGSELQINTSALTDTDSLEITATSGGGFAAVWQGENIVGSTRSYLQVFNSSGAKIGSESLLSSLEATRIGENSITELSDGSIIVAYTQDDYSGEQAALAQRYSAAGTKIGSSFLLSDSSIGDQNDVKVTALDNGGFAASWISTSGAVKELQARTFDSSMNKTGFETTVYNTSSNLINGDIEALDNGDYVLAWRQGPDFNSTIFTQRYTSTGTTVFSEFEVSTGQEPDAGFVTGTNINVLANGNYMVSWNTNVIDGDANGISAQVFDTNDDSRIGSVFQVNTSTAGDQASADIAVLNDGTFVASYTGEDADGSGIFTQKFQVPEISAQVPLDNFSYFGRDVAINGDAVAVGAVRGVDDNTLEQAGYVSLYDYSDGGGSENPYDTNPEAQVTSGLDINIFSQANGSFAAGAFTSLADISISETTASVGGLSDLATYEDIFSLDQMIANIDAKNAQVTNTVNELTSFADQAQNFENLYKDVVDLYAQYLPVQGASANTALNLLP